MPVRVSIGGAATGCSMSVHRDPSGSPSISVAPDPTNRVSVSRVRREPVRRRHRTT